jgi:hypothetical protein
MRTWATGFLTAGVSRWLPWAGDSRVARYNDKIGTATLLPIKTSGLDRLAICLDALLPKC